MENYTADRTVATATAEQQQQQQELQASNLESALLLVFRLLPSQELLCHMPLVCKAFRAAAATAYGSRPFSVNSFQLDSSSKTQPLAQWMQRHAALLLNVQLCGFKSGLSATWWDSICSAPYSSLQLCRACLDVPNPEAAAAAGAATQLRRLAVGDGDEAQQRDRVPGQASSTSHASAGPYISNPPTTQHAALPAVPQQLLTRDSGNHLPGGRVLQQQLDGLEVAPSPGRPGLGIEPPACRKKPPSEGCSGFDGGRKA
ncbi:hypothetical protein OEZ85_009641 [Tetradesmus obliquus]|uniref:F-box domain-containing protein n=1 Tax=Tetradesmus obliquus TaxID=3088 RepID=A0ABY8UDI7_TETOB|nr:hypothetical protein OEZ85_009641 [Tetradesmus obliquus]